MVRRSIARFGNPIGVRLTQTQDDKLVAIVKKEDRSKNWLMRYAIQKFLIDYKTEGLRGDVVLEMEK